MLRIGRRNKGSDVIQRFVLDAGHGEAALGVQQRAVDGDAEPAGEGAIGAVAGLEAVVRRDHRENRVLGADIAAFGFEAKDERIDLPVVADIAAAEGAVHIV